MKKNYKTILFGLLSVSLFSCSVIKKHSTAIIEKGTQIFKKERPKNNTTSKSNSLMEKGNYIWSAPITLAWKELCTKVLKSRTCELDSIDPTALATASLLNNSKITEADIDSASYYIKSGYGQKTVDEINRQSLKKFSNTSIKAPQLKLEKYDLISYANFYKKIKHLYNFQQSRVTFMGQQVQGLTSAPQAKNNKNLRIVKYWNEDKFILKVLLEEKDDELYLAKGFPQNNPSEMIASLAMSNTQNLPVFGSQGMRDIFQMPKISLNLERDFKEMKVQLTKHTAPSGLPFVLVGMFENIHLELDHQGLRRENKNTILANPTFTTAHQQERHFYLNKPFWVVMKRAGRTQPYFLLGVNNAAFMKSATGQ